MGVVMKKVVLMRNCSSWAMNIDCFNSILSIPLPALDSRDEFVWGPTSSGIFSAKSATWLQCDSVAPYSRVKILNEIWRLNIPLKLRDEDLNHLFFFCPFAANVWCSAGITNTDFQNFEEWFLSWFRKDYQKSTIENLLLLCRKIWDARNNLIFRHSPSLPNMVVHAAASIGENYRRNNPCLFKGPASTSQVICWLPPPAGFAKLNFNGSVVNNKKAAAGFVIRDHDGSPLLLVRKLLVMLQSPLLKEVLFVMVFIMPSSLTVESFMSKVTPS
ncbi:uncharacterized protein LOC112194635 [Rosa chinensis]|uniref:uncharacterized protein LOC112194635 n=1 Tax=Rosa chinensis TaxID=74649 RepID=UPI000D08EE75|nr:uncharacterized protein LOC112194635 [Rosa chinensis]